MSAIFNMRHDKDWLALEQAMEKETIRGSEPGILNLKYKEVEVEEEQPRKILVHLSDDYYMEIKQEVFRQLNYKGTELIIFKPQETDFHGLEAVMDDIDENNKGPAQS